MKSHNNLYQKICSLDNLLIAYQKARKGKTQKSYVIEFEKNLGKNLRILQTELKSQTYRHFSLKTFILRDPKTRVISKSDFRDRIVHHAVVNLLEPLFDKSFIYDSCANRKDKGTLFALQRFEKFRRKITNNFTSSAFCLKADVKHYFREIDHEILFQIIKRKIKCEKTLWLVQQIIKANFEMQRERE